MVVAEKNLPLPLAAGPEPKQNSSWTRHALTFFLTLAVATVFYAVARDINMPTPSISSFLGTDMACSGHGVLLSSNDCFCDLGYTGKGCESLEPLEPKEVLADTTAIFTDHFGPLGSESTLAIHYQSLAESLTQTGQKVTVVYFGPESLLIDEMAKVYSEQGILNLVRLPSTHLSFDVKLNEIESYSFAAYSYLRSVKKDFATVIFSGSSGIGFDTLKARHQGLACYNSRFIVNIDDALPSKKEIVITGDARALVTDIKVLKKEFMYQMSAQYADFMISPSVMVSEDLKSEWKLASDRVVAFRHIPTLLASKAPAKDGAKVNELVFINELTVLGGLQSFCDAIDLIAHYPEMAKVTLTFMGVPGQIHGMSSKDYIELRSLNWDTYDIKWEINTDMELRGTVDYLRAFDSGRVAIIPSLFDSSAIVEQELLNAGISFIGSTQSAVVYILDSVSNKKMLSIPQGLELSNKVMEYVRHGSPLGRYGRLGAVSDLAGSLALAAKFDIKECINPLKNAKKNSLVSVVLVHHNRANLLKEAIKSIEAQTYPNIEVILVDDGSTDADSIAFLDELAWKWWEEKGWKVVREPNRYLGASRNTGVKYATGNFVVFMDDDDFAKPHQIETFVKVALNTKASVITSGHDIFVGNSAPSGKSARRYTPLGAAVLPGMLENIFGDSAMFVERNYFVESGGFTEEQGLGFEDYEFLAKVALNGHHLEAVSEPLHWYRLHQGTMSESTNLKANQLRMLRAYTDRHWTASQRQKDLLEYTQKEFFKAGASPSEYKRDLAFMDRVLNNFVSSFSSLGVNSTHMGANSTHTSLLQSTTSSGIFSSQAPLSSSGISASSSLTTSTVSVSSTRTSSVTPSHTFSPNPCVNVCTVPAIVDMDPSFIPDTFRGVNISVMAYNIETSQLEIEVQSNDLSYKVIPKSAYTIGAKGTNGLTRISLDTKVFLETLRPVSGLPGTFTLILNQGVSFSAFDFTVYVTSSSILNGLAPMNFTVGEPIQVAFSGEHMLATKAPTCLFVDRRNNEYFWTVPSVYDFAASRGICEAPAATQATLFDFYISFNQPKNYLQYALHRYLPAISLSNSNTEVQIAILGAAPVAKSAIFDDSGTFIIVEFDLPIALKSDDDIVYCDDVFNTAPLGITGSSLLAETLEDCFVEIGGVDLLNVYLDGLFVEKFASQVIKPGDNITVKADAIVAGDVPFSQSKSSSTVVAAPASPDAPVIMAVSPSKIGGCSDFSLDVSQSYGSGGRAFTLLTVDVVPRLSGFQAAADGLKVLLNAQAPLILNGSLTEFFISASILKAINGNNGLENAVYDITITMKNAWERTATKTIELTSSVERFVPNAIIYGLGATEVDTRNYNSIAAVVSLPNIQACQDLANITYSFSWTLIGNTSTASDIQSSDSKLDLEPFTLLPNTDYTATVVISPRLLDAPLYSYSYPFRTALDTIITSAGSSRSVGASQYLILDAEIENDAYSVLPIDNFACVWNCTAQDGNSCQYSNGTQIILPSTCKSIDLTGKMSVGIYEFLVNATNSVTGAVTSYQSSTFIEISAGIVPEVSIDASSTNPSSWDESFSLIANVAASSIASVESIDFTWTSEPTCNSKKYSTVDLVYPRTLSVPLISSAENTLKFVPGALSPGASYCFKVSVTDTLNDDKTGYALAIIRVLEAPSGGSCAPSNSYTAANVVELSEFKDDLIFSCKGWTTDKQSFPLLYSFEMKPINSSTWTVLSPISRITDLKLSLSQGSYQIRANVTDSSGSKAVATSRQIFRINVRPLTFVVRRSPQGIYKRQNTRNDAYYTFVSDWLVQKLADFEQTRNSIGLITSISSVAFVGFEMPSIQKHIQLQSQLFTTINKAISDKVVTVDDSGAAFLLSSLQLGVGLSCGLPAANLNQSITLLDKILDTANTTLSTRSSSISSVTANFALLTLNNIMCSTRSTSASVQEKQNSILQKLSGALLRRASCGQTTVSSELSNITSIIGKAASVQYTFNKIRTFGQFSIDASSFNESAIAPDGCPLFQRGTKDSTQYPNGPYLDIDSKVYQMSYLLRSGAPAEVKNAAVNFSIPVDSAFASQFGVATHDLICSFVQYTDATENVKTSTLSTSGCTTVSVIVTGGVTTVNCQCTHLSDFVIGAQLKVVVPSSSSTVAASDNAAAPIATSTSVTTAVPTNVASSVRASATSRTTSSAIAGLAPATSTATAEAAGLSTGALAGIIVGSVIGAAALIALGLYVGYRVIPNKRNIYAPSSGPGDAESQQPEEPRKNKSNRHIVIDETPQIAPDAKSNKKRGSLDKDANSTNGMDEKGKSPNRNAPGYGDFS